MFSIKTMNKISPAGLARFRPGEFRYGNEIAEPDAFLVRAAPLSDLSFPPSLKAIACAGAKVEHIPLGRCNEAGIVVFHTPGANANAVKELTIASFILASRHVFDAVAWVKTLKGQGDALAALTENGKKPFAGPEIAGKKLGVIGLGTVGIRVANTAQALGMDVYGYDPYLSVESAWSISRSIHHAATLSFLYENCDYITFHVPLTSETRGLINASSLAAMKRGVRLFNFACGELAVTADLLEALSAGQVASYVTDFPESELIGAPGVLSLPCLGAATPESQDSCAVMAANELMAFLQTGVIRNSVNFPRVEMPPPAGSRVTIVHKNVPNMLTQITSCFASAGLNIDNIIDKTRGGMAYTLVDVSTSKLDAVADALRMVPDVIRVRVL